MADVETLDVMAVGVGNVGMEAASADRLTNLAHELGYGAVNLVTLNRYPEKVIENKIFMDSLSDASISIAAESANDDYWKRHEPDLVLVTTPSGIGAESYRYMEQFFGSNSNHDAVIVTAEKGAVTEFWEQLEPHVDKDLGIAATVGGGTQLLRAAREQVHGGDISRIDLVVNGTLGAAMELFEQGTASPEVARHMTALGYAEPGATDINGIFDGELGDIVKKAQIFYNYVLAEGTDYVRAGDIETPVLSAGDMTKLMTDESQRRMVVTFVKEGESFNKHDDSPAYVESDLPGGWKLRIAFIDPNDDPVLKSRLELPGVDAGFVIRAGKGGKDGVFSHTGPGAGPRPTARAMHADAYRLLGQKLSK